MDEEPKAVAVKVGRTNPLKRVWSFATRKRTPNPNRKPTLILGKPVQFWIIAFVAVCAAIVLTVVLLNSPKKDKDKIIFKIDGKNYSQTEIKPYTDFLTIYLKKSKEDATKDIYELMKYKKASDKLSIKPSDTKLIDTRNILDKQYSAYNSTNEYKKWVELESFRISVDQDLLSSSEGTSYNGYSFIFWFGNRLSYTPDFTPPGGYGDEKKVTEDRDYAKQRADYYREQVANNKKSADETVEEITKDPKLGYKYLAGNNFSVRFGEDLSKTWEKQIYYKPVIDYIKKNPKSGVSGVETGKISVIKSAGAQREETETFYYFVKIEGESSVSKKRFEDTIKSLKTEYFGVNQ